MHPELPPWGGGVQYHAPKCGADFGLIPHLGALSEHSGRDPEGHRSPHGGVHAGRGSQDLRPRRGRLHFPPVYAEATVPAAPVPTEGLHSNERELTLHISKAASIRLSQGSLSGDRSTPSAFFSVTSSRHSDLLMVTVPEVAEPLACWFRLLLRRRLLVGPAAGLVESLARACASCWIPDIRAKGETR